MSDSQRVKSTNWVLATSILSRNLGVLQCFEAWDSGSAAFCHLAKSAASSWWFQVSTHLKNIRQTGSFPQMGMKIANTNI